MEIKIDPKFRDKIPPLTDEEYAQLRENILADGEVYEPIVVWNGVIIDGHNRWKVIQEHPEIKYRIREMDFSDEYAAFEWMYRNQLGRRNLTDEQRTVLIGKMYEARKQSHGGDRKSVLSTDQNDLLKNVRTTAEAIALEVGVSEPTVKRAEQFSKGIDALRSVSNDAAEKVLAGKSGVDKKAVQALAKADEKQVSEVAQAIVKGTYKRSQGQETSAAKRAIDEMMDVSHIPTYTIDMLIESIELNGRDHVARLKSTLAERSDLLTAENRPLVADAIRKIAEQIEQIRRLVQPR